MPARTKSVPSYRLHKASRQAVVTLDGRDHYLGPWQSRASIDAYAPSGGVRRRVHPQCQQTEGGAIVVAALADGDRYTRY